MLKILKVIHTMRIYIYSKNFNNEINIKSAERLTKLKMDKDEDRTF